MDLRIQSTEGTLSNVCLFDTLDPNTGGTVFDPADLEADTDTVFVSESDASTWVYNGSAYITKTYEIPDNTPFWLYGTSLDAGGNKTAMIQRNGPIFVNSSTSNGSRYAAYLYSRRTSGAGNGVLIRKDLRTTSGNYLLVQGWNSSTNETQDKLKVGHNGDVTINDAYTLPTADGTAGQVLQTDGAGNVSFVGKPEVIQVAVSDETTALTTGTAKLTFRMPFAMTVTAIRASVTTAPTGADLLIGVNTSGGSIINDAIAPLRIDATEKTSVTAANQPQITTSTLNDDEEMTIDIDQVGSTVAGAGLKVTLIGNRA